MVNNYEYLINFKWIESKEMANKESIYTESVTDRRLIIDMKKANGKMWSTPNNYGNELQEISGM